MLLSALTQTSILASTYSNTGDGVLAIGGFMIVVYLLILGFSLWIYARILNKLGYSGWWVLLSLIPIVGLVGIIILAFKEAPVEEEVKRLRMAGSGNHPTQAQYQSPYGSNYGSPQGSIPQPPQQQQYSMPQAPQQQRSMPPRPQGYGDGVNRS